MKWLLTIPEGLVSLDSHNTVMCLLYSGRWNPSKWASCNLMSVMFIKVKYRIKKTEAAPALWKLPWWSLNNNWIKYKWLIPSGAACNDWVDPTPMNVVVVRYSLLNSLAVKQNKCLVKTYWVHYNVLDSDDSTYKSFIKKCVQRQSGFLSDNFANPSSY